MASSAVSASAGVTVSDNGGHTGPNINLDFEKGTSESNSSANQGISIVGMVFHALLRIIIALLIAVVCFYSFQNGIILFTWHPTLMIIGFLFLMAEAIMAFSVNSPLARNLKHVERVTLHWALQVGAASCILIAFLSIYFHKVNNDAPHFISLHANFGLVTTIFIAGTTSGGIAARFASLFSRWLRPVYLKIVHASFGIVTFVLGITTLCLGYKSAWFESRVGGDWVTAFILLTALVGLLIVVKPMLTIGSRLNTSVRSS